MSMRLAGGFLAAALIVGVGLFVWLWPGGAKDEPGSVVGNAGTDASSEAVVESEVESETAGPGTPVPRTPVETDAPESGLAAADPNAASPNAVSPEAPSAGATPATEANSGVSAKAGTTSAPALMR